MRCSSCLYAALASPLRIATTLRASVHVPGTRGVFAAQRLRAGRPLAIVPTATQHTVQAAAATAATTLADDDDNNNNNDVDTSSSPLQAPPYFVNLLTTPQHTITLRRFCALRHQFCSDRWLYAATPRGWYVLMPSVATPLQDVHGLQAWMRQHVYDVATRWHKSSTHRSDNGDDGNVGDGDEKPTRRAHSTRTMSQKKQQPQLVVPEQHVFEVNDAVWWPLPPRDDLASAAYWRDHRARMQAYVDAVTNGTARRSDEDNDSSRSSDARQPLSSSSLQANVSLCVDDATGIVALLPLVDVHAGEELLLHYGREWWTQRLLQPLILAAADTTSSKSNNNVNNDDDDDTTTLVSLRWIEALCAAPTDDAQPFPRITVAHNAAPRSRHGGGRRRDASSSSSTSAMYLRNACTHRRATDAEALAFAVRRSCTHTDFFVQLLRGRTARNNDDSSNDDNDSSSRGDDALTRPVFDVHDYDVEVPMRRLRVALLQSLCDERNSNRHDKSSRRERCAGDVTSAATAS